MNKERRTYQTQIKELLDDLSENGKQLVQEVAKIENRHRHKSRPTGIADEIVSAIKGIVK